MGRLLKFSGAVIGIVVISVRGAAAADPPPLPDYFRAATAKLASQPLKGIRSAEEWKAKRPELQRQLLEMLGLDPLPERTDLHAEVTGTYEHPDFLVEKLHYQSLPGLYVTANLYRPKKVDKPLPAILYVCGHSKVEKDGVIYGCKTHYQHHAAWYAANGYVCLIVDTLQLGEVPGLHHGMFREGMWWWQSRGYTPAGVEAWNGVRGIDYLISRPEVDKAKIGVTGRSGGGATSWWIGAIDDRVAAVAPVAGITDLQNHVVDGVIEGHCDCMFIVNTYRWDYPMVAALVAPKPLLLENTNHDPIFPEDGVRRVFAQLEKVYKWYGARDKLDLVIGQGGHVDSEEIRHPSFAFMNKWLKGQEGSVEEPARKVAIEDLKVLKPGEVLPHSRNAKIEETFVPKAGPLPVPATDEAWKFLRDKWMNEVRTKVFGGWPAEGAGGALDLQLVLDSGQGRQRLRAYDFTSHPGVRLRLWWVGESTHNCALVVAGQDDWAVWSKRFEALLRLEPASAATSSGKTPDAAGRTGVGVATSAQSLLVFCPRGTGANAWDAKRDVHTRRRYFLLGQTLDGMRVWDVRRALAALRSIPDLKGAPIELIGRGDSATLALWAAVFEPDLDNVNLAALPSRSESAPAFLNVDRILSAPQALALLYPRKVSLSVATPDAWRWASDLADKLSPGRTWPSFVEPAKSEPKSGAAK